MNERDIRRAEAMEEAQNGKSNIRVFPAPIPQPQVWELEEVIDLLNGPLRHVQQAYSKGQLKSLAIKTTSKLAIAESRLMRVANALTQELAKVGGMREGDPGKAELSKALHNVVIAINGDKA